MREELPTGEDGSEGNCCKKTSTCPISCVYKRDYNPEYDYAPETKQPVLGIGEWKARAEAAEAERDEARREQEEEANMRRQFGRDRQDSKDEARWLKTENEQLQAALAQAHETQTALRQMLVRFRDLHANQKNTRERLSVSEVVSVFDTLLQQFDFTCEVFADSTGSALAAERQGESAKEEEAGE